MRMMKDIKDDENDYQNQYWYNKENKIVRFNHLVSLFVLWNKKHHIWSCVKWTIRWRDEKKLNV
jgi:hypothetical protein